MTNHCLGLLISSNKENKETRTEKWDGVFLNLEQCIWRGNRNEYEIEINFNLSISLRDAKETNLNKTIGESWLQKECTEKI